MTSLQNYPQRGAQAGGQNVHEFDRRLLFRRLQQNRQDGQTQKVRLRSNSMGTFEHNNRFCSEMTFSQTWLLFVIVVVDSASVLLCFPTSRLSLNSKPLGSRLGLPALSHPQTHFKALVENWATIQTVIRKLSLRGELQRGSCWVSQRHHFKSWHGF